MPPCTTPACCAPWPPRSTLVAPPQAVLGATLHHPGLLRTLAAPQSTLVAPPQAVLGATLLHPGLLNPNPNPMQAVLGATLHHPGLLRTLAASVYPGCSAAVAAYASEGGAASPPTHEVRMHHSGHTLQWQPMRRRGGAASPPTHEVRKGMVQVHHNDHTRHTPPHSHKVCMAMGLIHHPCRIMHHTYHTVHHTCHTPHTRCTW